MKGLVNFRELRQRVLEKDKAIRFAGAATSDGEILATVYREGLTPLLTSQESQLSIMQSLIKMNMGKTLEPKLGKTICIFTEYQNVKTATFALYNQQTLEQEAIVLASFDKSADAYLIIEEKIKPLVRQIRKSIEVA